MEFLTVEKFLATVTSEELAREAAEMAKPFWVKFWEELSTNPAMAVVLSSLLLALLVASFGTIRNITRHRS